jgi:MOSC domain-containing protein YiiM
MLLQLEQDQMQFNEIITKVSKLHNECYKLDKKCKDPKFSQQIERASKFFNEQKANV